MKTGCSERRMDYYCLDLLRQRPITDGSITKFLRNPWFAFLFFVIAAPLVFSGCAKTAEVQPDATGEADLTDKFLPVNPVAQDTHINRSLSVIRKGLRKDALILIAPVSVRASIKGVSGRLMLKGLATPVFNIGDGIQMDLYLSRAGKRHFVGNRYFDSGRRAEDRGWIPIAFPLDLGEDEQLEIEISAGPQGDLVADWLALSSLHLMQRKVTQ
jgi:hypothetical protein